jgi:hypothetical protein
VDYCKLYALLQREKTLLTDNDWKEIVAIKNRDFKVELVSLHTVNCHYLFEIISKMLNNNIGYAK